MRHRKTRRRLQRNFSHRKALLENVVRSLFSHQQISTTHGKAKEAQKLADKLITLGKENTLHAKRKAFAILGDHAMTKKLFDEIAPLFKDRKGGYTRVLHMESRKGDAAPMALLELVEKRQIEVVVKKSKEVKKESAVLESPKDESKVDQKTSPTKTKAPVESQAPSKQQKKGSLFGGLKTFFKKKNREH